MHLRLSFPKYKNEHIFEIKLKAPFLSDLFYASAPLRHPCNDSALCPPPLPDDYCTVP